MSRGPNIWEVGADIPIEITLADPETGLGLPGKAALIELTIQRATDSKYWAGLAGWAVVRTVLQPIEVDATNQPGSYAYVLPGLIGNVQEDRYTAHGHIDDAPTIQGDSYETHSSRAIPPVSVYESEPT